MVTTARGRVVATLVAITAGAVLFGAPRAYRAATSPERTVLDLGRTGVSAPGGFELADAADDRMRGAIDTLQDTSSPPTERYRAYRGQLEIAERLLQASLRSLPAQADAITRLAAVRYELDPPVTDAQYGIVLAMVDVASEMAPRVPDVQARLGDLLFRMGRQAEALAYHRRAVELDPRLGADVVATLSEMGMSPAGIAEALPGNRGVLAALAGPFADSGATGRYLDLVDASGVEPDAELIARYGAVALASGSPGRILATFGEGHLTAPRDEAERLRQLARAHSALDELDAAREAAASACRIAPDEPGPYEDLGNIAFRLGDHDGAVAAFRSALGAAARGDAPPRFRARMYSRIGTVEEARGRPDQAYDSFRRAVAIDPDDPVASARLRAMRDDAGVGPGVR